jgi:uncharacterized protein YndB with AHSA1/START domain
MPDPFRLSHMATVRIAAPAPAVFAFLADPAALGGWSLGCMDTRPDPAAGPGIHTGRSLYDGGQGWFAIDADPERLTIDFRLGAPPNLVPRISARVVPGPVVGAGADACVLTLLAWRTATMDDDRWARLCAAHEAEVWLIKAQVESGHRPR